MSGKITYEPEGAYHVCTGKPLASEYRQGTKWECDKCYAVWVVTWNPLIETCTWFKAEEGDIV